MIRKYFRDEKTFVLLLVINICLSLFLASCVSVPALITIEALDERNIHSQASEIWIKNIEVDGEKQETWEVASGKWVWKGDMIGWRSYSQPDNMTRQVSFSVPAGKRYSITFESNQYRGLASISIGDESIDVDCYSSDIESGVTIQDIVPQKLNSYILQTFIRAICVAFFIVLFFLIEIKVGDSKAFKAICRKKVIWYAIVPVAFGVVVFFTADYTLWGDEMLQLGSVYNRASLSDVVESCVYMVDASPPLFALLAWIWVKLIPFGEQWIRLLPIILTMCSIVATGNLARVLFGEKVGVIALFCTAFSSTLAVFAGHQFRAYALYVLFSTITVLCFFLKTKSKKIYLLFSASMVALLYTHYYGVFVCGMLFLWDFYKFCKRKQRWWKAAVPYCMAGLAFLPWVVQVLANLTGRPQFWAPHPTAWSAIELYYYICSYQGIAVMLLLISTVAAVWNIQSAGLCLYTRENFENAVLLSLLMGIPLISYIADMVLGGGAGIFGERYFINLISIAVIFISKVISDIGTGVFKFINALGYGRPLVVAMVLMGFILFSSSVKNNLIYQNQTYRQAINDIMMSNDIYEDDSAIVIGSWDSQNNHLSMRTAVEYYATQKGERDTPIIYDSHELDEAEAKELATIYVINLPGDVTPMMKKLLDTEYVMEHSSGWGYSKYVRN